MGRKAALICVILAVDLAIVIFMYPEPYGTPGIVLSILGKLVTGYGAGVLAAKIMHDAYW